MKSNLAALVVALCLTQLFTVSQSIAQAPQGILISQYYEGIGNNRYIELWNPTANAIPLSDLRLALWSNSARENWKTGVGSPTASFDLGSISPGITLAPGQFLLLANPAASSPGYAASSADAKPNLSGQQILSFNGDDSIVLYSSDSFRPENVLDAFSLASTSASDKSFYRRGTGRGFDFNPGSQSVDSSSTWYEKPLANVDSAIPAAVHYLASTKDPTSLADSFPPTVIIKSATMRGATGLMDVVFRINDPDDATVKTRALAFIEGQRSFAKVIKPTTFAEGTESKLGDSIASNTDHTLTWNVAADWNISLGQIKFEILAMDTRGLLPLDWVTIPAANGQPELTISKNAPTDQQTLDALFWQYASGDPGLILKDGILIGSPTSGVLDGAILANGNYAQFYGPVYALKIMDLAAADERHTDQCAAARVPITDPLSWHALRKPFELFQPGVGWGYDGQFQSRSDLIIAGLAGVKAVSGFFAITRNGMVVSWYDSSELMTPADLRNVVKIAPGFGFCLALKEDGNCTIWATNKHFTDQYGIINIPSSVKDIVDIDSNYWGCFALKRDGTIVSWGEPQQLSSIGFNHLSGFQDISYRFSVGLGLRADGTAVSWGNAIQVFPDRKFKSISAGENFYLGLQFDDSVYFSGYIDPFPKFVSPPAFLNNIDSISAGYNHALALRKDGTVAAWGTNGGGQCDVPPGLANVKYIYAGDGFSVALKKAP